MTPARVGITVTSAELRSTNTFCKTAINEKFKNIRADVPLPACGPGIAGAERDFVK